LTSRIAEVGKATPQAIFKAVRASLKSALKSPGDGRDGAFVIPVFFHFKTDFITHGIHQPGLPFGYFPSKIQGFRFEDLTGFICVPTVNGFHLFSPEITKPERLGLDVECAGNS